MMKRSLRLFGCAVAFVLALGTSVHLSHRVDIDDQHRAEAEAERQALRAAHVEEMRATSALSFGGDAFAGTLTRKWQVTTTAASPVTGTAPGAAVCTPWTEAATEQTPATTGLNLDGCIWVTCAIAVNGTFTGVGQLDGYWWDPAEPTNNGWSRAKNSDELFGSADNGKAVVCFPKRGDKTSVGCGYWNPNAVGYGGGGTGVKVWSRCVQ